MKEKVVSIIGWIVKWFDKIFGHLVVKVGLGFLIWFYFRVVHRKKVKIIGRKNIPTFPGVLYYLNHETMMDSAMILPILFFPRIIFWPWLLPYTPAAMENFFKDHSRDVPFLRKIPLIRDMPIFRWIVMHGHGLQVQPGRKDKLVLNKMIELFKQDKSVMIFPEGHRTKGDDEIDEFKFGVVKIYYEGMPREVIPIRIIGAKDILPIGTNWPDWSKGKITIIVGKSIKEKLDNIRSEEQDEDEAEKTYWQRKWIKIKRLATWEKRAQRKEVLKMMRDELLNLKQ